MKKFLSILFLLIWMTSLASVAVAAEGVSVLVEGRAQIVKEDEALARSEAVKDALENALFRVAERVVIDKNYTQKPGEVKQALAGRVERYIGNYRIVSESRQEDLYEVEAQVLVLEKLLGEDLMQMGFLPQHRVREGTAVFLSVDGVKRYSDFIGLRNFLQSMPKLVKSPYPCRLGWQRADFDLVVMTEMQVFLTHIEQSANYAIEDFSYHQDGVRMMLRSKREEP